MKGKGMDEMRREMGDRVYVSAIVCGCASVPIILIVLWSMIFGGSNS